MRERRTFAERTRALKSDETKRKYFLVYEGKKTESIYFDMIRHMRDDIGINSLIELIPMIRSYSEDGWSNPKKILDRVLMNIKEEETGRLTYESLLNRIMDYLYDENILTTSKVQARAVWKILENACNKHLGKALNQEVESLEEDCDMLVQFLNRESDIATVMKDVTDSIISANITYEPGFDKICLIVDRDKESFSVSSNNDQYDYVLQACQDNNFGLYITNPCFEFWLLLHFDKVFGLDRKMLLENPKVTARRRYTEQELRKLLPGYSKGKYSADILCEKIEKAILNAEQFCQDNILLKNELGSSVGLLIKELKDCGENEKENFFT